VCWNAATRSDQISAGKRGTDGSSTSPSATGQESLPPDTEQRMGQFTDLVAIAVTNAQNRAGLISSRARIVAASDEARQRIDRDLHDGAQQRLLALTLRLRSVAAPHESEDFGTEVEDVAADLVDVMDAGEGCGIAG
jgi:signal transduction histidine kinase